jgi:hypothetical protein
MKVREQNLLLQQQISQITTTSFEKISKLVINSINNYTKTKNINQWEQNYKKLEDTYYKFFEKIYAAVSSSVNKIYKQPKSFNINDVFQLAYQLDGKTIEERLHEHWDRIRVTLDKELKIEAELKILALYCYERILVTEAKQIEKIVKINKKPINASLLVIESGCDKCPGGSYPPDEAVDLPPYHPNCCCTFYYEEANEDDIKDLDLEENL